MERNRRRHSGKGRRHFRRGVNRSVFMDKPLTRERTFLDSFAASHNRSGMPQSSHVLSPFLARVNADKCVGCAICQDICPGGAITIDKIARVDPKRCIGCGRCVDQCPQGALTLLPMDEHFGEKAEGTL